MKWPWTASLSEQVSLGYWVMVGIVLAVAAVQWWGISRLQECIAVRDVTQELLGEVLEIRWHEKGWLVYGDASDRELNLAGISDARHS